MPKTCSTTEWELATVTDYIAKQPHRKVYLEIGSWLGGSLFRFGFAMEPGALLIAVDIAAKPEQRLSLLRVVERLAADGFDARAVLSDSHADATVAEVRSLLGDHPVDVLMIDGDHSVPGAKADVAQYGPMVRDGGIMIFHDCGSRRDIKTLKPKVRNMLERVHSVFSETARGKRSVLVQEWCGYGIIWK